jgi:hypothetical protein
MRTKLGFMEKPWRRNAAIQKKGEDKLEFDQELLLLELP